MTDPDRMDQDAEFLLSIVDNPDSDYDDGLEGYPNFTVEGGNVLEVSFFDPKTEETVTGRWHITRIGITYKSNGVDASDGYDTNEDDGNDGHGGPY